MSLAQAKERGARRGLQRAVALSAGAFLLALVACVVEAPSTPEFNAPRALRFIEEQVAFGPRVPGSPAWSACKDYFRSYFDSLGFEVTLQEFTHYDRIQERSIPMTNLLIRRRDDAGVDGGPRVLLCAHWDSRPRCENDPDPQRQLDSLPGANDGAAGSAALMELAGLMAATPPGVTVDLALFDGEDWGFSGDFEQYCLGSKEFARRNPPRYDFAILVDIIAHPDARFLREGNSELFAPDVNDLVWNTARELGITRFVDSVGPELIDDHLSLMNVRIPAIDIIDLDYKYWHTTQDTPDKCDTSALSDVGRVLTHIVYTYGR
ncbi:MAG TPA: M28 family peptidase [candidate division Zixibacteria bacterium]|nr:M28 family peptidase [candidate division Zixibacteria bacterium]